jgi:hypothetical protein
VDSLKSVAGTQPIYAHFGHVLIDLPLFMGPVILLALALVLHARWVRRHEEQNGS